MKKHLILSSFSILMALSLVLPFTGFARAHGKTKSGDYALEIGFHNEPAYVNEPNSLDLFVTNEKTSKAVNGLESSLKAEIIFGASKRLVIISPMDGVDGGYTAPVIPTAEGDYTWHIFGTIDNNPVDVSMTSSPDTFVPVTSKQDDLFPPVQSNQTQTLPLIAGIAGIILGLAGVVVGIMAYRAARRH